MLNKENSKAIKQYIEIKFLTEWENGETRTEDESGQRQEENLKVVVLNWTNFTKIKWRNS